MIEIIYIIDIFLLNSSIMQINIQNKNILSNNIFLFALKNLKF